MAEDVPRVTDAIGEPPVVIGASLGGLTGLAGDGRWYWHWDPRMMQPPDWAEMDRLAARTRAAAARVTVSVLLVRGQLSDVVSAEGAADLLATIPHARYTDVAGTGHMVAGDDNSVFLDRVAEFLDREVR